MNNYSIINWDSLIYKTNDIVNNITMTEIVAGIVIILIIQNKYLKRTIRKYRFKRNWLKKRKTA